MTDVMTLLLVWDVVQGLLPVFAVGLALAAVWLARRSVAEVARSADLGIYLKFADEYDKLKVGVRGDREALSNGEQVAAMALLRLFEQEYLLHGAGLVSGRVWKLWRRGMARMVSRPAFRTLLKEQAGLFRADFVNELVKG